jgi:hypothetical protein
MLSCREETELMSQALDRPLSFGERFQLGLHLMLCKGCRATRKQLAFLQITTRAWREHHGLHHVLQPNQGETP